MLVVKATFCTKKIFVSFCLAHSVVRYKVFKMDRISLLRRFGQTELNYHFFIRLVIVDEKWAESDRKVLLSVWWNWREIAHC